MSKKIEKIKNKLIIIGNGFDLNAGLDSRFSDFFNKSEKPIVENWINWRTKNYLNNVSFISLLLYNTYFRQGTQFYDHYQRFHNRNFNGIFRSKFNLDRELVDWMDVEGFLYSILTSKSVADISSCYEHFKKNGYRDNYICICEDDCIQLFFSQCENIRGYYLIDNFYDFLLEELKIFEHNFISYMKEELSIKTNYMERSERMMSQLISQNDMGLILNFNYTNIKTHSTFKEINIHGSLDDDIIIGINDSEEINTNAMYFTKTFRKLVDKNKPIVLNNNIDEIIIYGHSLGKQDYSYFQSIFDFANIYSSTTIVKLVYSDNYIEDNQFKPGYTKNIHRIKMSQKLFNLLRDYGQTFDNKDNGRNLIHKMILEGRLKIVLNNFN